MDCETKRACPQRDGWEPAQRGTQVVSGVASSPLLLDLQVVRERSLETQPKADS